MNSFKFLALVLLTAVISQLYAQERGRSFSPNFAGYYYLRTEFTGDALSLECNGVESTFMNGAAFMSSDIGKSGQMWKFVPDPQNAGWYRLQTALHGNKKCLECNGKNSSVKGGASFMDNCQNVSGQLWRLELINVNNGDHLYRLRSMLHGDGYSLEGNKPDISFANGNSFMDETQNVTGQMWRLVPVDGAGGNTGYAASPSKNTSSTSPVSPPKNTNNNATSRNTLKAGETLGSDGTLISPNGAYMLRMQADDGHLCIYTVVNGRQGDFVWGSMKYGFSGSRLAMQEDGNLVVYDGSNNPQWATNTMSYFDPKWGEVGYKPAKAVLTDEGKLKLYNSVGREVWTNK